MARIETWFEQDLQSPVIVRCLNGNVFSMDNKGNLVGVIVNDGGSAASLSGTVSGNVIRSDGTTVAVSSGTLSSGNKCSIVLPQAAYAVPGTIIITIKLTSGTVITTLCALVAVVYRSSTDTIVDPGTIIPSIETLIAQIETAVNSIPADYSSLWASLAPAYSSGTAYAVGSYCTHSGGLYRCNTAITSESWTAAHWTATNLGAEIVSKVNTEAIARASYDLNNLLQLAPAFDVTTSFLAGEYCIYQDELYVFTSNHSAGSWIGTDAQQVRLATQLRTESIARTSEDLSNLLQLAPAFDSTTAYSAGDYCIYNSELYVFTAAHSAGSWAGTDAQKVKLANQVSALKSAIANITGNSEIVFSDPSLKQYINTNVAVGASISWDTPSVFTTTNVKWAVVSCSSGDKFTINGQGGTNDRLWAFTDSSKKLLSKSEGGATATDLIIEAPEDAAYLIINDENNKSSFIGVIVKKSVAQLNSAIIEQNSTIIEQNSTIDHVSNELGEFINRINIIDFLSDDCRNALSELNITNIGRTELTASYDAGENKGFYIPIYLSTGNYRVSASFTVQGTNNIRIFSAIGSGELLRLTSGTPATLTISTAGTYYIRLYYQANGSTISITAFDIHIVGAKNTFNIVNLPETKILSDIIGKKVGIVVTNNDYTTPGFLSNTGNLYTSSSYSIYSCSDIFPVSKGDTIFLPRTLAALDSQLGGYYFENEWVASLGSAEAESDGYYHIQLRNDIDYDGVRVNINNTSQLTSDFTVYLNQIVRKTAFTLFSDLYGIKSENVIETAYLGKSWVALGDSWTEGVAVATCGRYTDFVSQYLGLNCTNLGVGGTGVQVFADNLTADQATGADIITIWGSINNMAHNSAACGEITDTADANGTLMAKWNYTIQKVLTLAPNARIIIIGCPPSFHSSWDGYNAYNTAGDTIESSTKKIGELARHYGFPFIDMYHLSGFNSYNFGSSADNNFGYDKVHPSLKGVKRVSSVLIDELLKLQERIV